MAGIIGLGALGGVRSARTVRGTTGFHVTETAAGRADAPAAAASVSMPSLLAMQEAETGQVQDREARRHGEATLAALAALQRALLAGAGAAALGPLAAAMRAAPPASDPGLAAVQRALLVRVAVELARHRAAASA